MTTVHSIVMDIPYTGVYMYSVIYDFRDKNRFKKLPDIGFKLLKLFNMNGV